MDFHAALYYLSHMRPTDEELIEAYTAGESSESIGKRCGVSGRGLRDRLKKLGLGELMKKRKASNRGKKPPNYGKLSDSPALGRRYVNRNGRCMPYARWLMEQKIGRRLHGNEHVHHIDGNSLNDSMDNLTILTPTEHIRHHNPTEKRWLRKRNTFP